MTVHEIDGTEDIAVLGDMLPQLFRDVHITISTLNQVKLQAEAFTALAEKLQTTVKEGSKKDPIDPELEVEGKLERAESSLRETIDEYRNKRKAGFDAEELQGEKEELVTEAYTQALRALGQLHNQIVDLRWEVMEHDADLEDRVESVYRSGSEVIADRRQLF